jgi:hypothetical protein
MAMLYEKADSTLIQSLNNPTHVIVDTQFSQYRKNPLQKVVNWPVANSAVDSSADNVCPADWYLRFSQYDDRS